MMFTAKIVTFLQDNADFILHTATPVLWCIGFVLIMDRESLFEAWFMPFLGLLAAFLANSVPIGGGIVYIPALSLLGANITLGAAFTISVMPFGNGIFGLLRWLLKDPSVLIWESFQYTVLPSWIGSLVAMFLLPKPQIYWIKQCFGWFCFFLGVFVLLTIYRGGLKNVFITPSTSSSKSSILKVLESNISHLPTFDDLISERDDDEEAAETEKDEKNNYSSLPPAALTDKESLLHNGRRNDHTYEEEESIFDSFSTEKLRKWILVIVLSFLGGVILVPNIGIGPALITYFLLAFMGFPDQAALVTGIVTGGWVCILPFIVHLLVYQDIPWKLWIMVLPGVFYGAKVRFLTEFVILLFVFSFLFF
jgi:uncharacterized membrane protein YfcA